jgi:hypothetical protein
VGRKIPSVLFWLTMAQSAWGQTSESSALSTNSETTAVSTADGYVVLGATPQQETLIRTQIHLMQPDVYPLRVLFVHHWNYVEAVRSFRLHVPAGYISAMFTHLPSRSVFIDADRYTNDDALGFWVAHELGHLAANNAKEEDAEKTARVYRKRLKHALKARTLESW